MQSSKDELKQYIKQIQLVFDNPEGRDLLDKLATMYGVLFTSDTNEQYYRLGRHDIIQELKGYLNVSKKEIRDFMEAKEYGDTNPLDD